MKRVVITGLGVVSPNGFGAENYKQALLQGRSGVRKIQSFAADHLSCQIAGEVFLNGHAPFSKKEERNIPRVTRLAILASEEAFRDSALDSQSLTDEERYRFGVLIGSGGCSVEFMERHYALYYGNRDEPPSLYAVSSSTPGSLSSELSIRFHLLAQSHVITTGCTSSTDAIGYGYREIQSGRLDRALVGGADAPISEGSLQGFLLMKVLPVHWNHVPEKASRPFSKSREGFVLSEGAWIFILEERELAVSRGARIYGEIVGYGSSCEAFHPVRLQENNGAHLRAMSLACAEAGIPPAAIHYVNLHGSSTALNDRVESLAMRNFFGKQAYKIPMSSTKSMIGYPQGASGAAGLSATLLMMQENKIHPTTNLDDPDPECDLDYVPNQPRDLEIEYALCNTLGFGSKCSALVVRNE